MKIKFVFAGMLLALMSLNSCQKDDKAGVEEEVVSILPEELEGAELAFPDEDGPVLKMYYGLTEVNVQRIGDHYVMDGDIVFALDQLTEAPSNNANRSVGRTGGRWTNNIVYYTISPSLPNQARVTNAIAHWEDNTSIEFVPRTTQPNYVRFVPGSGCSSFVGRIGGPQNITLAAGCSTGSTIHEIGHAIGLWHEQSRADRDSYVNINFQNIQPGRAFNFQTYVQQGQDGDEYTARLDFDSIMMYGPFAFSSNGQPTITRSNGSTYSVQRTALSPGDLAGVVEMYGSDAVICVGVNEWQSGVSYAVGQKVTYVGNLFQRTATGWSFLGACPSDICDGVVEWTSVVNYQAGDLVTYAGFLYQRTTTGWTNLGACGTARTGDFVDLNDIDK